MKTGDFGVISTGGWAAFGIRFLTRSTVNHAFIYLGDGTIVEAQPAGARVCPLSTYAADPITWSRFDLTDTERAGIAAAGRRHVGDPYSWVDCACIGLADTFGWHVPEWVRRRLARPDRLMCSQLVDQCYLEAGIHLYDDGRIPGDVAPSDLLDLIK